MITREELLAEVARSLGPKRCAVPGCPKGIKGKLLCSGHLQWQKAHNGEMPTHLLRPKRTRAVPCSTPDCDRPALSRGLCNKHYMAYLRTRPT